MAKKIDEYEITKPGRPTNLTPELSAQIVKGVELGDYIETAAARAGVHKLALYKWLRRGARSNSGIHYDFANALTKAQELSEKRHLDVIDEAANGYDIIEEKIVLDPNGKQIGNSEVKVTRKKDWKAASWRLTRKNPSRYAVANEDYDSLNKETINSFMYLLVNTLEEKIGAKKTKEIIEEIRDQIPGEDGIGDFDKRRLEIVYETNGTNGKAEVLADPYLPALPASQQHLASEIHRTGMRSETGEDPLAGGNNGKELPDKK